MKLDHIKKIEERRLMNDKLKIQKHCEKLSLVEMRQALKEVRKELRMQEFKGLVKALAVKYDYDWDFLEDLIQEACPGQAKKAKKTSDKKKEK